MGLVFQKSGNAVLFLSQRFYLIIYFLESIFYLIQKFQESFIKILNLILLLRFFFLTLYILLRFLRRFTGFIMFQSKKLRYMVYISG